MGIVLLIEGSILPSLYYGFQHDHHLMIGYMGKSLPEKSKCKLSFSHNRSCRLSNCIYRLVSKGKNAPLDPDTRFHRARFILSNPDNSPNSDQWRPARQGKVQSRPLDSGRSIVHRRCCTLVNSHLTLISSLISSAARIPESLSPGTFDYFGSSHQIFHVFVLVGAFSQYCALRGMVWSRHEATGE